VFCQFAILKFLLLYFIFDIRNKKYILFVIIRQDIVCQLLIENCNFLNWSKINTNNLISIVKSNCKQESLIKRINLIYFLSTISIIYLRYFVL